MLANPTSRTSFIRLSFPISVVALVLGVLSLTTHAAEALQNEGTIIATSAEQSQEQIKVVIETNEGKSRKKGRKSETKVVTLTKVSTNSKGEVIYTYELNGTTKTVRIDPKSFADQKPLVIMNGEKYNLDLTSIDTNAIESIYIFKGEEAIAKFGSEGKNGVILIDMKSVDKLSSSLEINYDTRYSNIANALNSTDGKQPLLIVNGKEYTKPIETLSKNGEWQLKSISVIKDASATEKYGEKAKDGVIIIELKEDSEPAKPQEAVVQQKNEGQPLRFYNATAQSKEASPQDQKKDPAVEVLPEFIGGVDALIKYLRYNIQYPNESVKTKEQGRVVVKFVVGADGSISNVAIDKGISPSLDLEAVRVVRSMPKWKPGTIDGKPVAVNFKMPVTFKLGSRTTPTK